MAHNLDEEKEVGYSHSYLSRISTLKRIQNKISQLQRKHLFLLLNRGTDMEIIHKLRTSFCLGLDIV